MPTVEAVAVLAEDIPSLRQAVEASVVAVHFPRLPRAGLMAFVAGSITPAAVTMAAADIMAAGGTMALGSELVSTRLTAMRRPFAIAEDSTTSTACGGSIPVARSPMAIKASIGGGPSPGGPCEASEKDRLAGRTPGRRQGAHGYSFTGSGFRSITGNKMLP